MSSEIPTPTEKRIQNVLREIKAIAGEHFPYFKLENRLINLGLEEFVDNSILAERGFPFKFNSQLDEAILVLAHFLDRFKDERGSLNIYALNHLSKGEDRDLSYWQDAKAKLYLELQNIILLLNNVDGRTSSVSRIFTFGKVSDLAFLTQAGLNVLSEQVAMRIDIGFMFLEKFERRSLIAPLSNTLIINFSPGKTSSRKYNAYDLFEITNESAPYDLPYQESCSSKWYKSLDDEDLLKSNKRLEELLNAHDWKREQRTADTKWRPFSAENSKHICRLDSTGEFFNNATSMMYEAFARSSEAAKYQSKEKFILNRINNIVITRDMIRLQRAMSSFEDADHPSSNEIKAVDSASVKNSLQLHEARPTYRDWLRRSLNRVLNTRHQKLKRIYILKDNPEEGTTEFNTFLRIMQYYLDYFHYEISDMTAIVHNPQKKPKLEDDFTNQNWFKDQWDSFSERVKVGVTTTSILSEFGEKVLRPNYTFELLLDEPVPSVGENLANLDYLTTDHMIYNFLNPRADTDELQFTAHLYRNELNIKKEQDILFYLKTNDKDFHDAQIQHRAKLLAASIVEYQKKYLDPGVITIGTLVEEFNASLARVKDDQNYIQPYDEKTLQNKIEQIKEARDEHQDYETSSPQLKILVGIRAAFESAFFERFKRHFDYLYDVLEFQSLEVKFGKDVNQLKIENVEPFNDGGNNLSVLKGKLWNEVDKNIKTKPKPLLRTSKPSPSKPTDELRKRFQ